MSFTNKQRVFPCLQHQPVVTIFTNRLLLQSYTSVRRAWQSLQQARSGVGQVLSGVTTSPSQLA